jgi:hypothetical protein
VFHVLIPLLPIGLYLRTTRRKQATSGNAKGAVSG